MTINHNIKIPEKHYVTFQGREKNVPIAFLTPFGTDSAAKKRMATADNWSIGWGRSKAKIDPKTINNVLMSGFKVAHSVSRYSTSNVVWRILDPRGFELEISSPNMSDLIGITTIEQGEIQDRCIWSRQGANNVLLTENDPVYLQAIENSERIEKKVSLRDVKIGNTVVLSNGTIGQYMGCFHLVSMSYGDRYYGRNDPAKIEIAKSPKHFFYIKGTGTGHAEGDSYMGISSPKISEISDASTVLEIKDTELLINRKFANGEAHLESASGSEYRAIGVIARTKEKTSMEIELTHLTNPKAFVKAKEKRSKNSGVYWTGNALIAEYDGHWVDCGTSQFKDHGAYPGRHDIIRGNRICLQSLKHDLAIVHKDNTVYSDKPTHTGRWSPSLSHIIEEVLITDCKWHLPLLVYVSPVTQNKFEMPLP